MPNVQMALWLLPFCLPIALWVTWSDMKYMKIRNQAVLAMVAVWLIVGIPAVGLELWAWGLLLMVIVFILGFIANMVGLIGAGDAKFAAAMAGVFTGGDWVFIATLYVCCSIVALIGHRMIRKIPALRRMTPDWTSWTSRKFPMGIGLGLMLILYLLAAFLPQG